jgi:hypothetical protein
MQSLFSNNGAGETEEFASTRRFTRFLSESVAFVVTIAAISPLVADFTGLIKAPEHAALNSSLNGEKLSQFYTLGAALMCGITVLLLFWIREKFVQSKYAFHGVVLLVVGAGCVTMLHEVEVGNLRFLRHIFYIGGLLALSAGAALVFLFGFRRHQERESVLLDLAPVLDEVEWIRLQEMAKTMIQVRKIGAKLKTQPARQRAFKSSFTLIEDHWDENMANLRKAVLKVRGSRMQEMFRNFCGGTSEKFRAVSVDEFDRWSSEAGDLYLKENEEMAGRGVSVERIMVMRDSIPFDTERRNVCEKQLKAKIMLRFLSFSQLEHNATPEVRTDFGCFDEFAVCHWERRDGRVFRVSVDSTEVASYIKFYERLLACSSPQVADGSQLAAFADEWNARPPR